MPDPAVRKDHRHTRWIPGAWPRGQCLNRLEVLTAGGDALGHVADALVREGERGAIAVNDRSIRAAGKSTRCRGSACCTAAAR